MFGVDIDWQDFKTRVRSMPNWDCYHNMNIVLSGHSLGGAIALLTALELSNFGFNLQLITFGQPRILAVVPKSNKIKEYVRVVNPLDLITYLPCWFKHLPGETKRKFWLGNPHNLRRY